MSTLTKKECLELIQTLEAKVSKLEARNAELEKSLGLEKQAPEPVLEAEILVPDLKEPARPTVNLRPVPMGIKSLNRAKAPDLIVNTSNMFHGGYHLTDEQQHSINLADTGNCLKIEAGAGSGKTSDLSAISAHFSRRRGLYIAFNKDIVADAKLTFHHKTQCRTSHSLAYQNVGYQYSERLRSRLTSDMVVKALGLKGYRSLSAWTVASLLLSWVARFCQSEDSRIGLKNVPWDFLKLLTKEGDRKVAYEVGKVYAQELKPYAVNLWELLSDVNGQLPITHDVYLKIWALSNPRLPYDFILFDEAQDTSGVMMKLVNDQNAQKIWVGDRRQQIYAWRGAVNAMDKIKTTNTCTLTRSFRYGQPIAEMANIVLRNFLNEHSFAMVGSPNVDSVIKYEPNPTAFLCRTNRSAVSEMMKALGQGKRVHMTGGVGDLISDIENAEALKNNQRPRSPAFQVFDSWYDLVEYSESEVGADLAPLVKMLDQWTGQKLLNALRKIENVRQENADLVISTVHKAKGREFDRVKLADDFPFPSTDREKCKMPFSPEEANLFYVAITRAKHVLDISECTAAQVAMEARF